LLTLTPLLHAVRRTTPSRVRPVHVATRPRRRLSGAALRRERFDDHPGTSVLLSSGWLRATLWTSGT